MSTALNPPPAPRRGLAPVRTVEPGVLYFGTPVVLISTLNEDGSANLAPFSSAWWLGYGAMLGITASAHTAHNLVREQQCVLNLPGADLASHVNAIARTTGADPVPMDKAWLGFEGESDKWSRSGLTQIASDLVVPPRVAECAFQLEAVVESVNPFGEHNEAVPTPVLAVEVRIVRVHAHESVLESSTSHRVDADMWNPLIMSFRRFYGLSREAHASQLANGDEDAWRPAPVGALPLPEAGRLKLDDQHQPMDAAR